MNGFKLIYILIFSLLLSACSSERDENTWIVGTSADNPPYEYMRNGKIEGFDIDLMIAVGQHLGKNIEFVNMEFQGLLASLSSKTVDFVIAGMSVTRDRQMRVDFSIPYTNAKVAVLVKRDSGIKDPEGLRGKIVGSQLGTIWSLIAHDLGLSYGFSTKTLANNLMLVEELKLGRVSGIILEEYQVEKFTAKDPQFSGFSVDAKYSSSFAIAMPKNSINKKNINHTIKSLQKNGTIEKLARKWGIAGAD